ncbi:JmjC domain [Trinorchestia longiramus]|nr:JmjC domain [Trinorchestia longiramus]
MKILNGQKVQKAGSTSSTCVVSSAAGDFRNSSNLKTSAVVNNAQSGRTTVYRVGNNGGGGGSVVAGVSGRAVSITATSGPAPHTPSRPASPPSVSITAVLRPQQPPQSAAHHAALSSAAPLLSCSSPSPASVQQHLSPVPVSSACQPLMPPQPRMDDGSSDSGVSVSEPRSVSRSSVLSDERSSSAEVKPNTPTPQHNPKSFLQASAHLASVAQISGGSHNTNASSSASSFALDHRNNKEVRVWRDPALLSQSEQAIRHIHPLQHPMSYQPHAPAPPHPAPHHPSPHAAPAHPSLVAAAAAGALPPALGFPHSHTLHLAGLQPPLNAAAAAAYYGNPANVWKQLAGVPPPALHPSYHGLLSHSGAAQEEAFREFERSQQDRAIRDRRESEAREKERERAKMERDKAEREKRLREEEERKIREEKERQKHQVTQHFEESMRLFEQKPCSGAVTRHVDNLITPTSNFNLHYHQLHHLNNNSSSACANGTNHYQPTTYHSSVQHSPSVTLSSTNHQSLLPPLHHQAQTPLPSPHHMHQQLNHTGISSLFPPPQASQSQPTTTSVYQPLSNQKNSGWASIQQLDERRYLEQQQRHREELSRRHPATDRLVSESIYKAFRQEEDRREVSIAPPPAHSKSLAEKTLASNVAAAAASLHAYPSVFASVKDAKHRDSHYNMHHDKPSVIVQPDMKYDKPHSISPKQAVVGRASPYQQSNLYKNYEISQSPHRGSSGNSSHQVISLEPSSRPGSSLASSPHSVDLLKTRPPQSSPHPSTTSPAIHDRYYPSKSPSTSYPSVHPVHGSHASLSSHPSHAQLSVVHQQPSVSSSHSLHSSSQQQPSRSHPSSHGNSHSSLVSVSLVTNPVHVAQQGPVKSKVNSPPPQQVYIHPEHTPRGASSAHISHAKAPLTAPPPAHSGNRNHERIHPPPPHESRAHIERAAPFDARSYPSNIPSPHPKPPPPSSHASPAIASRPGLPVNVVQQHQPSHIAASHPTQTQPLDLGRRDDNTASPTKRRTQTPTPQDAKKPRLEPASSMPQLSKVPEPSPVYSPAMTTITSVENVVALSNVNRTLSPAPANSNNSRPSSQPPASVTPTPSRPESTHSPDSNSVGTPSSKSEPEKSNSPGPSGAGYVHKLKKAWLHRHESGSEVISNNPSPSPAGRSANGSPGVTTTTLNGSGSSNSPSSSHSGPKSPGSCKSSSRSEEGSNRASLPSWKSKGASSLPNGHSQDGKDMDSSSTDSDDGNAVQKPKRGKGKRAIKRPKKSSDSNSESDKESDGSETSKKSSRLSSKQDLEPKKRGRKPKQPKGEKEKEDGPKPKKLKEELVGDPLKKPPLHQLKKTGESFLQDGSCFEVSAKLPKCRECRWTAHQRNKKMPNIFCRFYAFRRLRYTKNGQLAVAGFSDPIKDAYGEDLRLWVPDINNPVPDLDIEKSKFLITHVGDQLCDLVQQEKQATQLHMARDHTVAWKRVVQGVREMCDVCETTLFNIHWACSKCGFVVCIDCYKGRKNGTVKVWDEASNKERDEYQWLLCTSRVPHEQDKLMLTQIISGNALMELGKMVHQVRYEYGLPQLCNCEEAQKYKEKELQQNEEKKKLNGLSKGVVVKEESARGLVNGSLKTEKKSKANGKDENDMANSPLNFFANVALSNDKRDSESSNSDSASDSDDKDGNQSTLRQLLKRPSSRPSSRANHTKDEAPTNTKRKPRLETLDDVISCVIEPNTADKETKLEHKMELKHFIRKYSYNRVGRDLLPIRIMTKVESSLLYPKVQHSWLCDGKLLRLHEPMNSNNIHVFQDQWKRGQPVMISGAGQLFKQDLWRPYSFSKDFGEVKNDLINCLTGNIVPNQTMRKFWDGFENYSKRLKDEKGNPMILKLKDWPPGDDFAEFLPKRFKDLMEKLPMGDYTRRDGSLNLAGRLPECFVKPDLGPKMYIAYGSALYPHKASTNLHLDISDAVNVMCYSGVPKDGSTEEDVKAALKAIDDAGCDLLTRRRAREPETVPGALWHIYHARDADKIRDLLNKVAIANGVRLEPHHDPIHDQSWYLDRPLRERLYKEYGVEGYSILQCMGDAVFIPAGAPHQVRNLHNCIKVAEDFVSPENVAHCFHLTQEFRHLSDSHTNHEDKLQIKNIIYHAMKDSVAVLLSHKQKQQSGKGSSSNGSGSSVNSGSNGVDGSTSPVTDHSLSSNVKIKREPQHDS